MASQLPGAGLSPPVEQPPPVLDETQRPPRHDWPPGQDTFRQGSSGVAVAIGVGTIVGLGVVGNVPGTHSPVVGSQ